MITGRGPGAPSVTPDTVFTLHQRARGAGGEAVDLSAIRRSEAIIDLLAARRLLRPRSLHDPAIALLNALAADVDSAATSPAPALSPAGVASRAGTPRRAGAGGRHRAPRAPLPAERAAAGSEWFRAAAAAAVIATMAGAAGTTGLVLASMIGRLARLPAGRDAGVWRAADPGWRAPARPRRFR